MQTKIEPDNKTYENRQDAVENSLCKPIKTLKKTAYVNQMYNQIDQFI